MIFKKEGKCMAISKKTALEYYKEMLTIRRMEEKAAQMYQQGKIYGFLHLYIGQEAVAVGSLKNIRKSDFVVTSYRDHAHAYLLGDSVKQVMAELFGKVTGSMRGKGGSMHFFRKESGFLGGHGIVGGQIPIGTGAAWTIKYQKRDDVSLTFFGDGAISQGAFFESANLASLHSLPVIYILENNEYGMGTKVSRVVSNFENIFHRGNAFGIETHEVDGMNVFEVDKVFSELIADVRKNPRPVFVVANTYRYRGHSISDPATYRTKEEVAKQKERDPINLAKKHILDKKWASEEDLKEINTEIKALVADAVKFAENSDWPETKELYDHVYMDPLSVKNYD
jgi:pyruvate dehydrogenase E1 component alpha subunit